jgi:glucose/arabinose dehydrogenase
MRRRLALAALVAIVGAACSGNKTVASSPSVNPSLSSPSPSSGHESPSPTPSSALDLSKVKARLKQIANLDGALAMAVRPGDSALYVAEQGGKVMAIRDGGVDPKPVLDVSGKIASGGERGLLGLTFSPDGQFLYVDYTDHSGDTNIVEYRMSGNRADAGSARQVLLINQPFPNHNGGNVVFGPDGYLYIGMGDGGSQGDPMRNGQNLGVLLAKLLRINPRPLGAKPYRIPPDNPFVDRAGARGEIWAYGLRNPWRFEFDRQTGDLWIADVGGSEKEEIDFQPADSKGGQNYGWNLMEGTVRRSDNLQAGMTLPVSEYDTHSDGTCAIVGGFVYRGSAVSHLNGAYLYSDNCNGTIKAIVVRNGKVVQRGSLGISAQSVASFGQDASGELYVLTLGGPVYKIVPA